jgi:hypothetical protein
LGARRGRLPASIYSFGLSCSARVMQSESICFFGLALNRMHSVDRNLGLIFKRRMAA